MTASEQTGTTQPATKRGQATRNALLKAAEEVFGEYAYDRAPVSEITRRAGVAQGTFYIYFPDKKAVFIELVHHLNAILRRTIASAIGDTSDRMEVERIGLRTFFQFIKDHTALYQVMREAQFVDPDTYAWHYETLAIGYKQGLETAIGRGQLSEDLDVVIAVDALLGMTEFFGWKYGIQGSGIPTDDQFDQILGFMSRGLMYQGGR
jgi:AcrR family transcriptional regulator